MKRIEGWRTFSVVVLGILMLVLGLIFVSPDHRKDVFIPFAAGLVGLASAYATKSTLSTVGVAAVNGDGLKGGVENLMTSDKPGQPKG
jgi:hypothetical protein